MSTEIINSLIPSKAYGVVYELYFIDNGKRYIGLTTKPNVSQYIYTNYERDKGGGRTLLSKALKAHKWEDILWRIVDFSYNKEQLSHLEQYYIKYFNCQNPSFGYNLLSGGHHGKHSESSKKKISESNKGRTFSSETLKKMSITRKSIGNPHKNLSPEALKARNEKISKNVSGKRNWNFGKEGYWKDKHHSEKTKETLRSRTGILSPKFGQKLTQETKEKIGNANRGKNNAMFGKPSTMLGKKHTPEAKLKMVNREIIRRKNRIIIEKSKTIERFKTEISSQFPKSISKKIKSYSNNRLFFEDPITQILEAIFEFSIKNNFIIPHMQDHPSLSKEDLE